ncbi:LysM peptidoglycan-binding domain-containing protein [Saccharopolyspora taberi]|uniref:LysM domain-containing protein n=1 Tax=Saccharopolyspora taberi TaxID=60895 RepID=A0ABN3VFH6_9PSEU
MAVFVDATARARRDVPGRGCARPGAAESGRLAERRWFERVLGRRFPSAASACRSRPDGEWFWLGSAAAFAFLIVLLVGLVGPAGGGDVPASTGVVQVRSGDTLWGLADRFAPDSDPRDVVHRIAELNDLDGLTAEVGQSLVVPMGRA